MAKIYLDNSATTKICREALDEMTYAFQSCYGNPSSTHAMGIEAQEALTLARTRVAKKVGCDDDEIIFTSGGTESNNLAIFGTVSALKKRGNRIVSTSIEHPSVEEPLKYLEQEGFEIIRLKPEIDGKVSQEDLSQAINQDTVLITMMLVNNEVGSIQPINLCRRFVKRANSPALIHCDAVQAFGKMAFKPSTLGIDLLSVSSHKIHGPKGVGALYIKKGARLNPHTFGGGQEKNIRSGTQAVPTIVGFGAAANVIDTTNEEIAKITNIRDDFISKIRELNGIEVNSPKGASPYIINISVMGIPSEVMLNYLSERGIYLSAGSACSRGHRSKALIAMGFDIGRVDSALRISLSRYTTSQELQTLTQNIKTAQKTLCRSN